MPSWSVKQGASCTFYHYCQNILDSVDTTNTEPLFKSLIKCFASIYMIFFSIDVVVTLFWSFGYWYFTSFYDSSHFSFLQLSIRIIFLFVYSTILTFTFFNNNTTTCTTHNNNVNSLKRISIISLIINVFICSPIAFILLLLHIKYIDNEDNNDDSSHSSSYQYENSIANYACRQDLIAHDDCQIWFSYYYIFVWCIYHPLSLFAVVFINHIDLRFFNSGNTNYNHSADGTQNSNRMRLLPLENNEMGIQVNNDVQATTQYSNDKQLLLEDADNRVMMNPNINIFYNISPLVLFFAFWVLWMIYLWYVYFLALLDYHENNLTYIFISLCIISQIFKFGLKFVARRIDLIRTNCNFSSTKIQRLMHCGTSTCCACYACCACCTCCCDDDRSKHQRFCTNFEFINYISLELLMELVVSLVYYYFNVFFLIPELSTISNMNILLEICFLHLLFEMLQSLLRFSKLYFDWTSNIIKKYQNNDDDNNSGNKLLVFIVNKIVLPYFKDESTFDEWRTRHSVDTSIRAFASMIMCVRIIVYYFVSNQMYKVKSLTFMYFLIYVFVDVSYFVVLFLVNLKYNDFNIWKPFLTMFKSDKKIFLALFAASYFFWLAD